MICFVWTNMKSMTSYMELTEIDLSTAVSLTTPLNLSLFYLVPMYYNCVQN